MLMRVPMVPLLVLVACAGGDAEPTDGSEAGPTYDAIEVTDLLGLL